VLFWVTTWYSDVVEYQRFRGSCCLHLHPEDACSMNPHGSVILRSGYGISCRKYFSECGSNGVRTGRLL